MNVVHEWNGVSEEFVSLGLRHRLDGVCLVLGEMPPWSRSAFSPGNSQIESACWVLEKILSWRRSGFSPGSEITMAQIILELTNEEDVPLIILSALKPWDPGVFPSVTSEKWIVVAEQSINNKNYGHSSSVNFLNCLGNDQLMKEPPASTPYILEIGRAHV